MIVSYLTLTNVCKQYRTGDVCVNALKDASFSLEDGEFAVVLGSSGAGKTTLLNLLGGMDSATSGQIILDGKDVTALNKKGLATYRRNDVGFVFQFYNLMPNLTALENVEIAVEIRKNALDPRAILTEVGLGDRMSNFPAQLSGGEQQRVSIARALAKNPKLLLCDEPTGALDSKTGAEIIELLGRQNASGTTVVIITHNSALTPMADRVIRVRSGQITDVRRNEAPVPVESIEW